MVIEHLGRRKRVKEETGNTLFRAYSTELFLGKEGLQSGRIYSLWDLGKSSQPGLNQEENTALNETTASPFTLSCASANSSGNIQIRHHEMVASYEQARYPMRKWHGLSRKTVGIVLECPKLERAFSSPHCSCFSSLASVGTRDPSLIPGWGARYAVCVTRLFPD